MIGIEGGKWISESRAVSNLPAAAPGSPNVLVIVVDTLRADHLSSYGYSRPTSPNIDNLARNGVLFENAIAPSSWSLPSHASLVTGRAVHEHGMGNVQPMPWLGWGKSGAEWACRLWAKPYENGAIAPAHFPRTGFISPAMLDWAAGSSTSKIISTAWAIALYARNLAESSRAFI